MARTRTTLAGETLYLVRRLYEGGWESIFCNSAASECPQRSEWGGPVKAFTARGKADALCGKLNKKILEGADPFYLRGDTLSDLTSLPAGPFRDWLLDVGLTPLPAGKDRLEDWHRWWQKNRRAMTAEQRQRLLAGLDKLRVYDVAELEPPASAAGRGSALPPARAAKGGFLVNVFTVELLRWKDDDDFLPGQTESWLTSLEPCFSEGGGLRLATFRDHRRAVAYRDELQRQRHVPEHSRAFYRNGFGVTEHPIEVEQ
jgi:hypothetical protein